LRAARAEDLITVQANKSTLQYYEEDDISDAVRTIWMISRLLRFPPYLLEVPILFTKILISARQDKHFSTWNKIYRDHSLAEAAAHPVLVITRVLD
jgi:hypothetical protein